MRIIAVDDEAPALWALERALKKVRPAAELFTFAQAREALDFARERPVDVAFLDIEMNELDGLSMAKALKDISPRTNIIFVTGHSSYMGSAFELHASGYVLKPIRPERLAHELDNLRNPVPAQAQGVRIQCFGNFSVFVAGQLLHFPQAKAKELLALLVQKRGAGINNAEIAGILWEDKPYDTSLQSQTRRVRGQLKNTLKAAGCDSILVKGFNSLALDTNAVSCDYYEFLQGNVQALNSYAGEFMSEYSWAEFTVGFLDNQIQK